MPYSRLLQQLTELPDRWLLPCVGMTVNQIRVDHQLTLLLNGEATLMIESPALISTRHPEKASVLIPARQEVSPALALFGLRIESALAFKNGSLHLTFDTDRTLTVQPEPSQEAWQLTGPGSTRVVCLPGGELAIWA